jgi:glycine/D-amino acid oxidase-like deaminating enzyme
MAPRTSDTSAGDEQDRTAIIGSGINSLVAAAELALAGKRVTVVESSEAGRVHPLGGADPSRFHP